MAKINFQIKTNEINGMAASQEFEALRTQNQVGDKFYVPEANMLMVLSTVLPALDRNGNQITDGDGNPRTRHVGHNFFAVRIIDGQPVEVVNLYVGQLVKQDINGSIVFHNELYNGLRKGDKGFKDVICNKILQIEEEKEIMDRVWDQKANRWARDPENPDKLAAAPKRALRFEAKRHNLSDDVVDKCNEMLLTFYLENYPDRVVDNPADDAQE